MLINGQARKTDDGDAMVPNRVEGRCQKRPRQMRAAERVFAAGYGRITTELGEAGEYFYAEGYHQQYLAKNPDGYCGIGGTGVACPTGVVGLEGSLSS